MSIESGCYEKVGSIAERVVFADLAVLADLVVVKVNTPWGSCVFGQTSSRDSDVTTICYMSSNRNSRPDKGRDPFILWGANYATQLNISRFISQFGTEREAIVLIERAQLKACNCNLAEERCALGSVGVYLTTVIVSFFRSLESPSIVHKKQVLTAN